MPQITAIDFVDRIRPGTAGTTTTASLAPSTAVDENKLDEKFVPVIISVEDDKMSVGSSSEPMQFDVGGLRAWMTIAGAFLIQFTCFGYIGSFGVYEDFYVRRYLTKFSTSDIGWIGGIQICLTFMPGIITGRLFDRGYFYHLLSASIILYALALFMLSITHEGSYYQVFLTNGVTLGLATGITYSPSLAIAGHYFQRKRPLTVGIISSGSALGAVIQPIMLNRLINGSLGFHKAVRVSAAMNVTLLLVALSLMRTRLPPKQRAETFAITGWFREPAFLILCLSCIPCFLGLFFAPFYIQLNAVTHGVDSKLAFYSISVLNAGSVFGRIIPGALSPYFGAVNMAAFFTISAGVVVLSMIAVKTFLGTVFFGAFFGLFSGAAIALSPAIVASLAHKPNEIGTRLGVYFGLGGFVGLFATTILGTLLTQEFHWIRPILFAGIALCIMGVMILFARHFLVKQHGTQKI